MLLETRDLTVCYDSILALNGVSLSADEGEITAFFLFLKKDGNKKQGH